MFVKLLRCAPRRPKDLNTWCSMTRLFFRMAALLPHHQVDGLGEEQQEVVQLGLQSVAVTARSALRSPASGLTAPLIDLLRSMATGTRERAVEVAFKPSKHTSQLLTHRYMHTDHERLHGDGLAQAELFYESLCAGLRFLERLAVLPPPETLDESIQAVQSNMSALGLVFLFDGCRLRRGLEVGLQVTADRGHSFGLDRGVAAMLSDGESNIERLRVGVTLRFFLAACLRGCADLGDQLPPGVLERVQKLETDARLALQSYQADVKSQAPGKTMRVLLDLLADLAEEIALGKMVSDGQDGQAELVVRVAFGYPCLVPEGLEPLVGYDGGLLSVWDACLHLFNLHTLHNKQVLSYPALLSAVLAGVVTSLMTSNAGGPFRLHPQSDVAALLTELTKRWPPEVSLTTPVRPSRTSGKMVSVNASIRGAMDDALRVERQATPSSEARTACALSMLSVNQLLLQGPGMYEGGPTGSIAAIKRMYISCFAMEAGEGAIRVLSGANVNVLWRDLLCGALVSKGPLCSFTRSGLKESLRLDWCSERSAESTESGSEDTVNTANTAKMLPTVAVALVFSRATKEVDKVTTAIIKEVEERDGSVYVARVCETARFLSSVVHATRSPALWEAIVSRFCSPRGRKRSAEEEA